jgi:WD40 repeat protein
MRNLFFIFFCSTFGAVVGCSDESQGGPSATVSPSTIASPKGQTAGTAESEPQTAGDLPDVKFSLGHAQKIDTLVYSRDERFILTASDDATLVWEARTRRELLRLTGSEGYPYAIHTDLGNHRYLLRSREEWQYTSEWAIFNLDTLELQKIPYVGGEERIRPQLDLLILGHEDTDELVTVDLRDGSITPLAAQGEVMYLHPSGRWLISQIEGDLQLFDRQDKTLLPLRDVSEIGYVIPVPGTNQVWNVNGFYPEDYDPDDYNYEPPMDLSLIDLNSGKVLRSFRANTNGTAPVESQWEGDRLIFSGYGKGGVLDLETETWTLDYSRQIEYKPNHPVVHQAAKLPDGRFVRTATSTEKGRTVHALEIVDGAGETVEQTLSLGRDSKFVELQIDPERGITRSGKQAVFFNQEVVVVVDLVHGTIVSTIPREAIPVAATKLDQLFWDPTSDALIGVFFDPSARLAVIDPADGRLRANFGDSVASFRKHHGTASGVWAVDQDDRVVRMRFTPHGVELEETGIEGTLFAFSRDGSILAAASYEVWDPWVGPSDDFKRNGQTVDMQLSGNQMLFPPSEVTLSPDGTMVATGTAELLHLRTIESNETKLEVWKDYENPFEGPTGELWITEDNRYALLVNLSEEAGDELHAYQLTTGSDGQSGEKWQELLWKRSRPEGTQVWAADRSHWWIREPDRLLKVAVETGAVVEEQKLAPALGGPWHFNFDRSEFFIHQNETIRFFRTADLKPLGSFAWDPSTPTPFYTNSPDLLAAPLDNGLFTGVWRRTDKELNYLAKLALLDGGRQWILVDQSGRFDSSSGMEDKVFFALDGGQTLPLGAAFAKLHTPRLWESLTAGIEIPPPPLTEADLAYPPLVKLRRSDSLNGRIEEETIDLTVEASSPRGPLAEIRLYHNGKLIGEGTRGLTVEDDSENSATFREKHYTLALEPGSNTLRAVAVNEVGIESEPAELTLVRTGETSGAMRLFVLAVGINEYANPKYNLNYAHDDAKGVLASLRDRSSSLFGTIVVEEVFDRDATREAILAAFKRISAAAGPRDSFLFYYAGHGVMAEGGDRQFYLAPTNVTQLYGDDAGLAAKGISSAELLELSKQLPAQKQLFILDACQAAGALQTVGGFRGAAEERAIAQLARSTGTHWLTAAGSEQFAAEFKTLGHGVFTYALLDALSGSADAGDGRVTVNDLKGYLESRVPDLTREHRGLPQYPASYGYGQDFPITLVPAR